MIVNLTWINREEFDMYRSDPILNEYRTSRDIYCDENGIIVSPLTITDI